MGASIKVSPYYPDWCRFLMRHFGMKIVADNRNFILGLVFAIATVIGFTLAGHNYRMPLGRVRTGERVFNVSLEEVTQYQALFPGQSLQQWLGIEQADVAAAAQLRRYHGILAATMLCGLLTVFLLGLHLEALRSDQLQPELRH
jgi:hypothetical protein